MSSIKRLGKVDNVFGDNIAFVEHWDFSRANTSAEARIEAITTVASICYDNPNVVGKESLYNRLAAEAAGLPSSSFEFVPVLLDRPTYRRIWDSISLHHYYEASIPFTTALEKYGEWIIVDNKPYLLSNYRALYAAYEQAGTLVGSDKSILDIYNTTEECEIIKQYHNTFLYKMDLATSKQHNRHRVSLQELSRRYVSGKKTKFEFYYSTKLSAITANTLAGDINVTIDMQLLTQMQLDLYYEALDRGVKPQEARRVLNQAMYTTVWSAFLPYQLENYLTLRDDSHAQTEIMWLAQAMKKLLSRA